MGEMTREEVLKVLRKLNPARLDRCSIYADAFIEYKIAQKNIDENGAVVFHPRTNAPIDNPYIKIRNGASATLQKISLKTDGLWD